jgi:hypothetical protein
MAASDRTEYILQTARLLGITVPEEEIGRVKGVFGALEGAAAQVLAASLRGDTVAAAVFRPEPESKK